VPAGCRSLTFGETALWLACPAENKVLRINPATNLVDKSIEVSAQPEALAVGAGSIWVLCRKDGKIDRIDPKTNKVSKTIELGVPNADGGIAFGESFVWVTQTGFPLARIDVASETVVQQFSGDGGGAIAVSAGAIWLPNVKAGTIWRIDPKRVMVTLPE
jgi:streptogramin lyase